MWYTISLWVVVSLFAVSIPLSILQIGKERTPITREMAAFIVMVDILLIAGLMSR